MPQREALSSLIINSISLVGASIICLFILAVVLLDHGPIILGVAAAALSVAAIFCLVTKWRAWHEWRQQLLANTNVSEQIDGVWPPAPHNPGD